MVDEAIATRVRLEGGRFCGGPLPRRLELAVRLCEVIVANEISVKANEALQLLATGSPFALFRVVELAELLLAGRQEAPVGRGGARSSRGSRSKWPFTSE